LVASLFGVASRKAFSKAAATRQPATQCLPIMHFLFGGDDVRCVYFMPDQISLVFRHLLIIRSNTRHVDVGQLDNPVTWCSINDMLAANTYLATE